MVERDRIDGSGDTDFRIGEWLVRPELGLLERGERSVHLEARTMAVLVCLARHAPNLVTKERLLREVWAGTPFVSDDVISHAVWELRRALGDSARSPTYIETLARKGYRLKGPVGRPVAAPVTAPARPRRGWRVPWAAAFIACACLPIGLALWPRGQARDHQARTALEAGRRAWLAGNHRENLELVRKRFERAVTLAPGSAEALGHLAVFKAERFAVTRDVADRRQARELAARARVVDPGSSFARMAEARLLLDEGRFEAAEALARESREAAPSCGAAELCDLAYTLLAEALFAGQRRKEAFEALDTGLRVGGGAVRCRLAKARLLARAGETAAAIDALERVLAVSPRQSAALAELGRLELEGGSPYRATKFFHELAQVTGDPRARLGRSLALHAERRFETAVATYKWDDAISAYEDTYRRFQDEGIVDPTPAVGLGDTYLEIGDAARARLWFERALADFAALAARQDLDLETRVGHAVCLAKAGRFEAARAALPEPGQSEPHPPAALLAAAKIAALEEDEPALFELARRARAAGSPVAALVDDAAFIRVRNDPRYLGLLETSPGASL